jgi:tetratricopeptide (TPR) repeat protein
MGLSAEVRELLLWERGPVMTTDELRVERCQQQVQENPGSAVAQFNLGLAYTRKGLVDRAEKAYREALEIDSDLVEAWVNLGGVLMLKWDFEGSMEANREALSRKEDLVLAHFNTGQACLYLGDADGVVHSCRRVIELDPNHAAGCYFLAVGLLATGNLEQAREAVARAKALGHSPAPDFLRALENAQKELEREHDKGTGINMEAEAPKDSNRR